MIRQTIDEYLDGALDAAGRDEVKRSLAGDPAAARLLAQIKAERALRTAVFASYAPTATEAVALAEQVLDAASAPVGRLGLHGWIRITAGVAAGLVIAAGAFGLGRVTAPAQIVTKENPETSVITTVSDGPLEVRKFNSSAEAQNYIRNLDQAQQSGNSIPVMDTEYFRKRHF